MKSRSHLSPAPTDAVDYWDDGSWTVDCRCGINYDDGDEMVDCDECGVWVHTRCSGFVKGEASFTCDKCKAGKSQFSSSADRKNIRNNGNSFLSNKEETEVAQLLVELPTKADLCSTLVHRSSGLGLWREVPTEERVHVTGVPGGDTSLFQGMSSVFTPSLWKCTGYVPKKLNFKYKEFSCWDNDESENPANAGANLLFSLSKETVPCATVETSAWDHHKGPKRRDCRVLCNNGGLNFVRKERSKLRASVVCSSKRKEESAMVKESCWKTTAFTEDLTKGGSTQTIHGRNMVEDDTLQVPNLQYLKMEDKKIDVTPEHPVKNCDEKDNCDIEHTMISMATEKPFDTLEPNLLEPVKLEKPDNLDHLRVETTSSMNDHLTSVYGANTVANGFVKKEDVTHDDKKQFVNASNYLVELKRGSSSAVVEKSENIDNSAIDFGCITSDNLNHSMQSSVESKGKEEPILEESQVLVDPNLKSSLLTRDKMDLKKSAPQRIVGHSTEDLPVHETFSDLELDIRKSEDSERDSKPRNRFFPDVLEELSGAPAGQEGISEHGDINLSTKRSSLSADGCHKLVVSVGKDSSSSFLPDVSKLPVGNSYKSPGTTSSSTSAKTAPFTKRIKLNTSSGEDRENDISKVNSMHREMSRRLVKTHLRSSVSSEDKPFQRHAYHAPSKYIATHSKENVRQSSSKASSPENSASSSGSGKPSGSLKSQTTSMQFNYKTSNSNGRNGKTIPSSSHTSSKLFQRSSSMHPPLSSTNVSATLSDEELAKRLHQELNSSPRVSRVPRGFHASGLQSASSVGTSMLSKCSSSTGGKFQVVVSRQKNKENTCEPIEETNKLDTHSSLSNRKRHAPVGATHSLRRDAIKRKQVHSPSIDNKMELASLADDDSGPASCTLPALIDEIVSKENNISYEGLCDAVLPYWPKLRKATGQRYAHCTHFQAVHDYLRNRKDLIHLIHHGTKVRSDMKKAVATNSTVVENESITHSKSSKRSAEKNEKSSGGENVPRGRRNIRKRRRLALQGRAVMDFKERRRREVPFSQDFSSFIPSNDEQSASSKDDSGGVRHPSAISETSDSTSDDSY